MSGRSWTRTLSATLLFGAGMVVAAYWLPEILLGSGAPATPPAQVAESAYEMRLREDLVRIEELTVELAAFAREGRELSEEVLLGEEMEPWARIVYSDHSLAEKLLCIYREMEGQDLAVARMQLGKEASRRPEVADQLLVLL